MQYVRIYADPDGESHFEDIEVPMQAMTTVTGVSKTEGQYMPIGNTLIFTKVDSGSEDAASLSSGGWGPWHPAPPHFTIWLEGEIEIEVSDGEVRRFRAGEVVLGEDATGKGHRNRRLSPEVRRISIPLVATA